MREIRHFGEYSLDPERRRLERVGEGIVPLGTKAFDALVVLVEHAGEPVARKVLMDALWPDTVVEENNLGQAISALRRALGEGYIATLPGRGYQFIAEIRTAELIAAGANGTGLATEAAVLAGRRPSQPRGYFSWAVGIVAVLAVVAAAALVGVWSIAPESSERGAEATLPKPSIAVLPFVNVSADPAQDYFADGLSDEVRIQLGGIDGLRVVHRTSSFAFKGRNASVREIGDTLNVDTVLEGTVRRSANRLRVSAELASVADGYTIWSSVYEREIDDVFAIQDEIARAVVDALSPALGVDRPQHGYGGTSSFEAYDHFLRGLTQQAQFAPQPLTDAAHEFRRALEIDPGFGQAWAELGAVLSQLAIFFPDRRADFFAEREEVAQQARALAPELPTTQSLLAWIAYDRHDWEATLATCAKIFAGSRDARAEGICSGGLTGFGYVRDALPYRETAARTDPLAMGVSVTLARHYALLGESAAVEREHDRSAQLGRPGWGSEEPALFSLMHQRAAPERVAERLEHICHDMPGPAFCSELLEATRIPEEASQRLRGLLERLASTTPQNGYIVALFAAYFEDRDLALDALELFGRTAPPSLYQHLWYPLLADVRAEPRFKGVMREIGFADLWEKTGRWNDYCYSVGQGDFECR